MKNVIWILVLLHMQSHIEGFRVDREQHCDARFLPGFDDCLCDYEDKKDQNGMDMDDLVKINCTNLRNDNVKSREMLSQLSESLSQTGYTHLEELIFVGNKMHDLPTNLVGRASMAYLERLDLSHNDIHTIKGKTFHSMAVLNELILDNNEWRVDVRSSRVFSSIFNIEVLSLNNAFTTGDNVSLHVTALSVVFEDSKLDYLKKLYLENNRMLEVSAGVFQRLPSLEELSLANNNINKLDGMWNSTCIPSEYVDQTMLLDHLCPLKVLDLSNNQITTVSADFIGEMKKLKNLKTLNLTNNPFVCDYHLLPFYDFLMEEIDKDTNRIPNENSLMCAEPSTLRNQLLISLSREELSPKSVNSQGKKLQLKHKKNVAGIVLAVLISIIAVFVVIAIYINRNTIRKSLPSDMSALKRYLPSGKQGYKKFEFKDDKVEPVGV